FCVPDSVEPAWSEGSRYSGTSAFRADARRILLSFPAFSLPDRNAIKRFQLSPEMLQTLARVLCLKSANHQYGDLRVGHDFGGLAAENESSCTATTMRGHDDQIAVAKLSDPDD